MSSLQPLAYSATRIRTLGVILAAVLVTALYSLKVIVRSALGRLDRARVDYYTRAWSARLLHLVRMQFSVHGTFPEFGDGRRYLILCSHSSHFDIPVSFVGLPGSIRMLAKQELFRIPLLGAAMQAAEFPSIDRHNRERALADLQRARQMMESGIVLWAAPEGTRSPDGRLLPFKKGCFHLALDTGAIIVPVAIRGIHHVLPARSFRLNLGQPVQLRIGTPIDAGQYRAEQLDSLMAQVRQQMQGMLD
ncbi:lysophospholipid acyltransferase family protein [Pseudomonas sp. N040]|uniref:lysophospholipid acyltransferase family protein n=1 Tax=Pseudomonas sp. N040 TaxID=2785325 RepID=UPI0018A2A2B9|nr:lysophospholipid acyltransferase family protein [Pseudomonas sp. N040]MBF7729447.1 1-acyl-sn-glycerol-3-phosphate acyltransferase [Pseudomonas sp. N040]MBW7013087.1 1-acyl-sn-glycerol-3-phosphate acyltransferase [Pseudomonas sp. N040]